MSRRRAILRALLLACVMLPALVLAQARARLERQQITLDETVTLRIETDSNSAPDYAPLLADFDLSAHTSRRRFEWANGRMRSIGEYAVSLRPRRGGVLQVPPLRVGSQRTAPLVLRVLPPATAAVPAAAGRDIFIESVPDDPDPYVQQAVGWVVRLYSALPLVSGRLDQDAPQGATLQRVGDDLQYRRTVGGRDYLVIERRYLLLPERSGVLAMPEARFEGRGVGSVFDRMFGDGQVDLRARAAPRRLQVRPIPADAPQPWLPLHSLSLNWVELPQGLRAGEAANVVVQVLADGASGAQMPELRLPDVAGAQVFAERAQVDESVVDGRPRVRVTRRFSVVPAAEGPLRIAGPRLDWWDVAAGQARVALLPPLDLTVAPGMPGPSGPPPADVGTTGIPTPRRLPGLPALAGVVALLALALAAAVAWSRRRASAAAADGARDGAPPPAADAPSLPRLLELGDLPDIEAALRAMAPAGTADLDALAAALADDDQRTAVRALRDARWGGGEPSEARARLRAAFARGPVWRRSGPAPADVLPPLYPRG